MRSPGTQAVLTVLFCFGTLFLTGAYQDRLPEKWRVFIQPADLLPDGATAAAEKARALYARTFAEKPRSGPPRRPNRGLSSAVPLSQRAEKPSSEPKILEAGRGDRYLRPFFKRLAELEDGADTVVRVMHYGDSINWGDNVTVRIKQLFQKDFGDGGRGLVNITATPAMRLLEHTNQTRGGFYREILPFEWFHFKPLPRLGFTAVTHRPALRGAVTSHRAPATAEPWQKVRVILRDPRKPDTKGELEPYITDVRALWKDARGKNIWQPQEGEVRLAPGDCDVAETKTPPTRFVQVHFERQGVPYIDGIALETKRGVSYSSLVRMGVHMAWMSAIPLANRACGFRAYKPDLVIQQFGTNESASIDGFRHFNATKYREQLKRYLEESRKMLPDTPILVFGPFERLVPSRRGLVASPSQLRVREIQREVAAELGLPFFDSYLALGGPGHMARLVQRGFAHTDYMHITGGGGNLLGARFHGELMQAYARFRGRAEANGGADPFDIESAEGGAKPTKTIAADAADGAGAIQFHSKAFAYFLGAVLLFGNFFLRYPRLRLVFLVLASYYFYATWKLWPLSLIVISTIVDYTAARGIGAARDRGGRGTGYLLLSLTVNLGLLFFFKYFDFLAGALNDLYNATLTSGESGLTLIPALDLLLPVGISFYTFQTLSYTIDVYRGQLEVEKSPLRFALYVTFFPQLVAGPIVRAKEFLPGLREKIRHFPIDRAALGTGTFLIFAGLLKKSGADWLAVNVVDRVYLDPSRFTSLEALSAVYAYGLQIYGDFSGYTDIAIGSAMLLGLRLTENFRRPYQSASISEFWRRWHISLGSWFRDYVYIPLGGNRNRVYANLLVTMFLVGLWHGAGWNFVFWGLLNAAFLMGERLLRLDRQVTPETAGQYIARWLRVTFTLHLVLFSWIVFRVQDWDTARGLWEALLRNDFRLQNVGAAALAVIALAYAYHLTPIAWRERLGSLWNRQWSPVRGVIAAVLVLFVYNIKAPTLQPYIYFQF